jgi:hypothetical protein
MQIQVPKSFPRANTPTPLIYRRTKINAQRRRPRRVYVPDQKRNRERARESEPGGFAPFGTPFVASAASRSGLPFSCGAFGGPGIVQISRSRPSSPVAESCPSGYEI